MGLKMIILDLHFINSTESVPMRFSHRRTVKMNKKNKRKRKNNPIKFYKKFPKIKQVKNTKKRKTTSTLSNNNNNNNNNNKKQKTKLTFDEQRKYFKQSYDLMMNEVQSLDQLNNNCLDEETLIECLYISCFNDNDDNIATFLAHGLSLEPPVDFLQPEVAKKFISERLHGDELHIAHNDTVLLDGYDRAGFRGPITDQLRKKIPSLSEVHDNFIDVTDCLLTILAIKCEELREQLSKKYNFDASRKKEKNTEVVLSSRLENLILNWNLVHCKEKPKNADREFQKIDNFYCIGFLETSAKPVYNK